MPAPQSITAAYTASNLTYSSFNAFSAAYLSGLAQLSVLLAGRGHAETTNDANGGDIDISDSTFLPDSFSKGSALSDPASASAGSLVKGKGMAQCKIFVDCSVHDIVTKYLNPTKSVLTSLYVEKAGALSDEVGSDGDNKCGYGTANGGVITKVTSIVSGKIDKIFSTNSPNNHDEMVKLAGLS